MLDTRTAPYAALILRLVTGALFLTHGLIKLLVFTPAGTAGYFASLGLPGWLGYLTMAVEILGGIALILGLWTRIVAVIEVFPLLGAILFVHAANGFGFTNPGGGWEYPALWMMAMIVLALLGDGAYALRPTPAPRRAVAA
ncbi:DoxX family protein [Acidimangrovimonas sediminis]|uniref:DoxX family protein n=1 Tax=Acidimangrovimonas sediminis TaxID=2056283 RepID=UPI000C7F9982|nr:DoxX family protein [Acidimangrovimonas sediminis]